MTQINERLQKIAKTITRSDGSAKIYGATERGDLLTVVMQRDRRNQWTITEISVAGRITAIFPAK